MTYYYLKPKFKIYPDELKDILLALGVLTLSFWILMSRGVFFNGNYGVLFLTLITAFLSVLIAFFLHEMAHKYVAIKYGYPAAFKAWKMGLLIAFFSSFIGFLFAAPGAVYIYGFPSVKENGKISAAGPTTNLIAGFSLLAGALLIQNSLIVQILLQIAYLNFFLAFFNLLPIGPMDGLKILRWNLPIYAFLFVLSIAGIGFFYLPFFIH